MQLPVEMRRSSVLAKRVLVIDDEEDIREIVQASLMIMLGVEVILASSGQEGLQKAVEQQPDAILLDVMLTDVDGIAVFQKLQANPMTQQISVIFLTAKSNASDQLRFAQLGVNGVITKPFNPAKLAEQLLKVLGWQLEN
jgi:CheY-like chemotaxis protein